jgi:hypothetical protein
MLIQDLRTSLQQGLSQCAQLAPRAKASRNNGPCGRIRVSPERRRRTFARARCWRRSQRQCPAGQLGCSRRAASSMKLWRSKRAAHQIHCARAFLPCFLRRQARPHDLDAISSAPSVAHALRSKPAARFTVCERHGAGCARRASSVAAASDALRERARARGGCTRWRKLAGLVRSFLRTQRLTLCVDMLRFGTACAVDRTT